MSHGIRPNVWCSILLSYVNLRVSSIPVLCIWASYSNRYWPFIRQIWNVAHHKLRTVLAASDPNIELRVTGINGDPAKTWPCVHACSRDTDGTLHKSDVS